MNAVIYPRVSSLKQLDGTSLEVQEKACRDWCEQKGILVEMVFLERGESAKTADRKQLQAALAYVKARGDIDYFVVHKVDRFARRSQDYFNLRDELKHAGCRLVSASEQLDDTPAGRFMEGMLSLQAQFDNEVRAERSKAGMVEVVKKGGWAWAAPIGFQVHRTDNNLPTLIHDPDTAPLIRMIFEKALSLHSLNYREISEYAYSIGLRSRTGRAMSKSRIFILLSNPVYAARGRTRILKGEYKGKWEPIVDMRTFNRVQERLARHSKTWRVQEKEDFYLDGMVKCAKCGRTMIGYYAAGRGGRKYPYFRCSSCKGQNIKLSDMHLEFESLLDRMRFDQAYVDDLCKMIRAELGNMGVEAAKERECRLKAIAELEKKERRLFELVMAETISEEVFKNKSREISAEIEDLKECRTDNSFELVDAAATFSYLRRMVVEPRVMWCKASRELKLELQRFWFPDGIMFDKKSAVRTTLIQTESGLTSKIQTLYNVVTP